MFKLLRSMASRKHTNPVTPAPPESLAMEVAIEGVGVFPMAQHLGLSNGFVFADWPAVNSWVKAVQPPDRRAEAWAGCERVWLQHLGAAMGRGYRLTETPDSWLLSSLAPNVARATQEFIGRTSARILRVLEGIARAPEWGKDILIVFDDEDSYYAYVAHYYPEDGEFAMSGGMYINAGCGHFVTVRSELQAIEPVIAHELTHACLAHLPIPAWLNEGIAVNTERRLTFAGAPLFTPQEMYRKHRQYWDEARLQEFWSGKSFLRSDDGNMLSYDLARIMVEQLGKEWDAFRRFVLTADLADSGAAAAREHLGMNLGVCVSALLQREYYGTCEPNPSAWTAAPERGAFKGILGQTTILSPGYVWGAARVGCGE